MLGKNPPSEIANMSSGASFSLGNAPPSAGDIDAAVGGLSETPLFLTTALSHMRDGKCGA